MIDQSILVILLLVAWDFAWKGIGLWKSARKNHLVWFICILLFNTAGILPIIYVAFFADKNRPLIQNLIKKKNKILKRKKR